MAYNSNLQCVLFRNDLRVVDNPALSAATYNNNPTFALFFYSENQWLEHNKAEIQIDLIKRRLIELEKELSVLNIPLIVVSAPYFSDIPERLKKICDFLHVSSLFANREYEHNELTRDAEIATKLNHTPFSLFDAKCTLSVGSIINKSQQPYKVFTPFKKAWREHFYQNRPPIEKPQSSIKIPPKLLENIRSFHDCSFVFSATNSSKEWSISTPTILNNMRQFCRTRSSDYHKKRDYPAETGTSQLSPYLAIGALSSKQCILRLHLEARDVLNEGQEVWLDELIWREFYTHLLYFYPALSKNEAFLSFDKHLYWSNNIEHFQRWCNGETGYPIVDSAMKQLNKTGWMHNRLRMVTASFLVKDLHINWRWGEQYFMSKLIDGDFASNNGGWQWCASVGCDSTPYFRIFNPTTQSERFDSNGVFIKHWLPELTLLNKKDIHQPTRCPLLKPNSYQDPVVDHSMQRQRTLEIYKQAKEQSIAS